MAFRTDIVSAVVLIMAHPLAMETGSPVAYMRVQERFVILSQGKIRGFGGVWVIRDVEIGWECGALRPEVIQKSVYLGNRGSQTELGASS